MTKKISLTFLLVFLCLFGASAAAPQEILVVQNHKIKPYADAFSGFKSQVNTKRKGVDYVFRTSNGAVEYLSGSKPDLILAIGMDALQKVKIFSGVPIVYLMVLNPAAIVPEERNITGVSMAISPEKQLAAIRRVLPSVRRIGLLYDPKKSGSFVKRAQNVAKELKIELLAKEVSNSKGVPAALISLKGAIDAYWMIPDTTVATPDTIELMMLYSLESKIPVCTFSTKYLEIGALMSLDINAKDMGRQAGGLALKILSGKKVADIPAIEADTADLVINESVARNLKVTIDDDLRGKARFVR
ncbi:MAG: ABC transporter substrate-binding protein [Deltaproteobacteria bacterium]|nr:ABC transporter substrate-binding protein [Deltaproteobacteria bacterium]TLN01684.1 MAG: ABC transporter substrate-binding protein [bacterium]